MIKNLMAGVAMMTVLALAASGIAAQKSSQPDQKTKTVTGCVVRGEATSAYKLVAQDGTWNLSGSAKLMIGSHVGDTVTVRGNVAETFDTKTKDKGDREVSIPNTLGILNVSKITMVSASCAND